ncbi:MAG: AI-2E family transporter [Chthonomonadales bacterium]|nr:AI-2E family transporter [Chthonomonadales bacterium]
MPEPPTQVRVTNFRALGLWALVIYLAYSFLDAVALSVLLFAVAFFLAIVLDPPVRWLDKRGLSRGPSVAIILLLALTFIGLTIYLVIPPVSRELNEFMRDAPDLAARVQGRMEAWTARYPFLRDQIQASNFRERAAALLSSVVSGIGRFSLSFLGGLFGFFLVLVITIYAVADPSPLLKGVLRAFPRPHRTRALRIFAGISRQFQVWVGATFWLMLAVGVVSGFGLWIVGVQSPLVFGILAGLMEAVPTIGPVLSAIPPAFVALADDPMKAVWVLVVFFVVQQLENNLLVPRIMASAMNLHPVSVLFFVVAMGAILGPLGILLATPTCAAVKVVYKELYLRPQRQARRRGRRAVAARPPAAD